VYPPEPPSGIAVSVSRSPARGEPVGAGRATVGSDRTAKGIVPVDVNSRESVATMTAVKFPE
ncbi:MAG: hypothetical protein ACRECR_03835, partial [Thermoplasmata archaeon]